MTVVQLIYRIVELDLLVKFGRFDCVDSIPDGIVHLDHGIVRSLSEVRVKFETKVS